MSEDTDLNALKIIERITKAQSKRLNTERREELDRILRRIDKIYGDFDQPSLYKREFSDVAEVVNDSRDPKFEYVDDMRTLEKLIKSHKWRMDHVKQVTIFIVGYSQITSDRLRLLQEVNQFFVNNEDAFDWFIERGQKLLGTIDNQDDEESDEIKKQLPDWLTEDNNEDDSNAGIVDIAEIAMNMDGIMIDFKNLTDDLARVNQEMIECVVKYMQNKAGNKGKKKLEKSLENAVAESHKLQANLTEMAKTLTEKESKIKNLLEQLEAKSKEVQKAKTHADNLKKAAMESEKLKQEIKLKNERIIHLETELESYKMKIEEVKIADEVKRQSAEDSVTDLLEKNKILEENLHQQKVEFDTTTRKLKQKHELELKELQTQYENAIKQMKEHHKQEIMNLQSSEFDENAIAIRMSDTEDEVQESKPSTAKEDELISKSKPTSRQGSSTDVLQFSDSPELTNEEFWSSVPRNHIYGRFIQYRQKCLQELNQLKDQLSSHGHSNSRQILALKSQHQAHYRKWQSEREALIDVIRKTDSDRQEAQDIADQVLGGLEDVFVQKQKDYEDNQEFDDLQDLSLGELADKVLIELDSQNFGNGRFQKLLRELIRKCKIFDEKTRISLPKFATMLEISRKSKEVSRIFAAIETQTDHDAFIFENRDIIFPPDITDEKETKDACVGASPSLLNIALIGSSNKSSCKPSLFDEGVMPDNSYTPNDLLDIQDQSGLTLIKHPIVCDYLHSYDTVLTFKEKMTEILGYMGKTDSTESIELTQLRPVTIKSNLLIIPQVEEIGKSIELILQKSSQILEEILLQRKIYKRQKKPEVKPPVPNSNKILVSSLLYFNSELKHLKQDIMKTQKAFFQKFNIMGNVMDQMKQKLIYVSKLIQVQELQPVKSEQSNKAIKESKSLIIVEKEPDYRTLSIIFTRRDSERNLAKLQSEFMSKHLDEIMYQDAINKMSDYTEIPAKRLLVLVKKYMHKATMDKIAEYVRMHNKFTKSTFQIIDGVERLSEKKQRRYGELLEYFRAERVLRAQMMEDSFDKLQETTQINLIRPVISKKSRELLPKYIETEKFYEKSAKFNERKIRVETKSKDQDILTNRIWNPLSSVELSEDSILPESKILEIDINRMLLPLNNVSTKYYNATSHDENSPPVPVTSMLPPQVAVRSYVAVAHPTLIDTNNSSSSILPSRNTSLILAPGSVAGAIINAPANTIIESSIDQTSIIKSRLSRDLTKHSPLPPITPTHDFH